MSEKKSNKPIVVLVVVAVVVVLFFAAGPFYVVEEGEQAVVVRFGEIVSEETEAGLKIRTPLVDDVRRYPQRIQSWDGDPNVVPTAEGQFIHIDATARWRIAEPAKFYAAVTTMEQAFGRLDDLLDAAVRRVITENRFEEAVRSSNLILERTGEEQLLAEAEAAIQDADLEEEPDDVMGEIQEIMRPETEQREIERGRRRLAEEMRESVSDSVEQIGAELIDIVIREVRYDEDLTESVYERMVSERNQEAEYFRSLGEGQKERILGEVEYERERILSEARGEAARIRGQADEEASRIYAGAYGESTDGFYDFYRSISSYDQTLANIGKTLTTDMDYFRFLHDVDGAR